MSSHGSHTQVSSKDMMAMLYGLLNVVSTVSIVIANKAVMQTFGFKFPVALTWCHSLVTAGEPGSRPAAPAGASVRPRALPGPSRIRGARTIRHDGFRHGLAGDAEAGLVVGWGWLAWPHVSAS